MYWLAVILAVISGVAAAIVDDFRPPPNPAPQAAPQAPKASHAPDGTPITPAETPIEVAVPREGVPSVLPLITTGPRIAPVTAAPERKPGESRRRRRSRPGTSEVETAAVTDGEHVCPACGAKSPKRSEDLSLHASEVPAVRPVEAESDESDAAVHTGVGVTESAVSSPAPQPGATDASTVPASEISSDVARRRPLRERLTMQLATRGSLTRLVEHQTAPTTTRGAGEEG